MLQSVVCKWAGQFGECASGTSAPLQRPGTPQHQVLEPTFHIPTHFNRTRMQTNHFNYSGSVNPALAQPPSHYVDNALTVYYPVSFCLSLSSNCIFCDRDRSNSNRLFRKISYNDCVVYKFLSNFEILNNLEIWLNFNQMVWTVIHRPSLLSHRPTRLYFLSAPPLLRYEYREAFVAIQPTSE